MSCFHPLKALYRYNDDYKKEIVFCNETEFEFSHAVRNGKVYDNKIDIPCGQCIGCRLEYSRQWAIRCVNEASLYSCERCFFITLTYDNDHLPFNYDDILSSHTSLSDKFCISPTLRKADLSAFIKRVRSYFLYHFNDDNIRFFGAGEYGDTFQRPHYHLIFFNISNPGDFKELSSSKSGYKQYSSKVFSDLWKNGFVSIGSVTFDSASYVSRYMTKKHKGKDSSFYFDNFIEPEFSLMSRRPGIGYSYYQKNKDKIFSRFSQFLSTKKGTLKLRPAKYYQKLFESDNPDLMSDFRDSDNYLNYSRFIDSFSRTDVNSVSYSNVREQNKLLKIHI